MMIMMILMMMMMVVVVGPGESLMEVLHIGYRCPQVACE